MTDAWSARADAYRTSPTHREGDDLDALVAWCDPGADVEALDVATGGGHVARRLAEAGCRVTTCDAAEGMRPDVVCPAEALAFPDRSFDVVACRIAAHHFDDVAAAVREMARVTRRLVVIEDTLYADERVEEAERAARPDHVPLLQPRRSGARLLRGRRPESSGCERFENATRSAAAGPGRLHRRDGRRACASSWPTGWRRTSRSGRHEAPAARPPRGLRTWPSGS